MRMRMLLLMLLQQPIDGSRWRYGSGHQILFILLFNHFHLRLLTFLIAQNFGLKWRGSYLDWSVAEFPGEDVVVGVVLPSVVFRLAFGFAVHCATASSAGRYGWCRRGTALGFRSADDSRPDAARLLVAIEDLWHAAVRDAQLPGDDARTDSRRRQLDDLQPDVVRQRAAVDEHSAELIDATLAYNSDTFQWRGELDNWINIQIHWNKFISKFVWFFKKKEKEMRDETLFGFSKGMPMSDTGI